MNYYVTGYCLMVVAYWQLNSYHMSKMVFKNFFHSPGVFCTPGE